MFRRKKSPPPKQFIAAVDLYVSPDCILRANVDVVDENSPVYQASKWAFVEQENLDA